MTARRINAGQILLRIDVFVANGGNVLLKFESGVIRVNQVLPEKAFFFGDLTCGQTIIDFNLANTVWPTIANRPLNWLAGTEPEIEPNEIDEFNYDFIIPSDAKIVEIYIFYRNVDKYPNRIGWGHTSIHDLTNKKILPLETYNC
jgi:hypothetical protein